MGSAGMAIYKVRIYYHHTDCGGVVYYGTYLELLEEARTEFLAERGVSVKELAQQGTLFVVSRNHSRRGPQTYKMDAIEAIKTRRSIREYLEKPIAKSILEIIVDAARFAPTARGVQPWEFLIITNPGTLKRIGEIAENGRFVSNAGACIAVYCSETKYYLEDGCAATQNLLIAATSQGIASCWVAGDKKPYCSQISKLLNVPDSLRLVSLVALGYPGSDRAFKIIDKKNLKEIMHWEKF